MRTRWIKRALLLIAVVVLVSVMAVPAMAAKLDYDLLHASFPETSVYDGTVKHPEPIVSYAGKLLTKGTDYKLEYGKNTNVTDSCYVEVVGIGAYSGISKWYAYEIQPISIAGAEVSVADAYYYGTNTSPEGIEVILNGVPLQEGIDFHVVYTEAVTVGENVGKARVVGDGNYTGYVDATFDVVSKFQFKDEDVSFKMLASSYSDKNMGYAITTDNVVNMTYDSVEPSYSYDGSVTHSHSLKLVHNGEEYDYYSGKTLPATLENLPAGHMELIYTYNSYWTVQNGAGGTTSDSDSVERKVWLDVGVVGDPVAATSMEPKWTYTGIGWDRLYLYAVSADPNKYVGELTWSSSDPSVASVENNGVLNLHKAGSVVITAAFNGKTVKWDMDLEPLDVNSNMVLWDYNPETGKALVSTGVDPLTEGKDYTISVSKFNDEVYIVTVKGINNFGGEMKKFFYTGTRYPYVCTDHFYTDGADTVCDLCDYTRHISKIDIKTQPNKRSFYLNDPLDLTGGVITITYTDKSTGDIPMTTDMFPDMDTSLTGNWSDVARYKGYKSTKKLSYTVSCKDHKWSDWRVTEDSTCEEMGTKIRSCSVCRMEETGYLPLGDHSWSDWEVYDEADCDSKGEEERRCYECGEYEEREIPPTGHKWSEWEAERNAECGEPAYEYRECKQCYEEEERYSETLAHNWGEWKTVIAPTEDDAGEKERFCKRCGESERADIPALGSGNEDEQIKVNPFVDVAEGKFFYEPVLWAYYGGITTGKDATHFNPSGECTRAQVVTFLWRAAGEPAPTSNNNPFPDVPAGKYYTNAVLWAVEKGITGGFKDGTFGPNKTCTRAQIVTFLWRYAGEPAPSSMDNPFPDVDVSAYYGKAVLWAVEEAITGGFKDGTFGPNKTCTRDQIVTFLYRHMVQ